MCISSGRSHQLTEMCANLQNCAFSDIVDPGIQCPTLPEAGGKPSTWFPPGILVELIEANELVHPTLTSYKTIFSIFKEIDFSIFENYFSTYQLVDTRKQYYLIRRILDLGFRHFEKQNIHFSKMFSMFDPRKFQKR